jgi:hypothetical protein
MVPEKWSPQWGGLNPRPLSHESLTTRPWLLSYPSPFFHPLILRGPSTGLNNTVGRNPTNIFDEVINYSQTCVQWLPLGPEKRGRYAEGCMKKISGK